MRVLVCGGRDYADADYLRCVLSELPVTVLIEGEAPGADTLARLWAQRRGILIDRYPADWDRYGKAAGPIRNQQMLDEGKPDLVVAFPGGHGTADMVRRARAAGIAVTEILEAKGAF